MQRWHGVHLTYVLSSLADVSQPCTHVLPPAHLQPGLVTTYANILLPHSAWLPLHLVGHTQYVLLDAKVLSHLTFERAADAPHPPVPIA